MYIMDLKLNLGELSLSCDCIFLFSLKKSAAKWTFEQIIVISPQVQLLFDSFASVVGRRLAAPVLNTHSSFSDLDAFSFSSLFFFSLSSIS